MSRTFYLHHPLRHLIIMDPEIKCRHNLTPIIYTSKKQPGRQFYRCPRPIGDEQCNFFLWLDEAIPSPSQSQAFPLTPQPAQPQPYKDIPLARKRSVPDDLSSSGTFSSGQSQKRARQGVAQDIQEYPGMTSQDEGPSMSQETAFFDISEELSADAIAKKLQSLNQLPEYIRKLERKKKAAELSRDAKGRKIADLEAEVKRLKQREKELEQLIEILEA